MVCMYLDSLFPFLLVMSQAKAQAQVWMRKASPNLNMVWTQTLDFTMRSLLQPQWERLSASAPSMLTWKLLYMGHWFSHSGLFRSCEGACYKLGFYYVALKNIGRIIKRIVTCEQEHQESQWGRNWSSIHSIVKPNTVSSFWATQL